MKGVNLIPADRRRTTQRNMRLRRWGAAMMVYAGLVLAACVGARITWAPDATTSAEELTQLENRNGELNAKITQIRKAILEAQTSLKTALSVSDQPDWSILLTLLGQTVGDEVVLQHIQLKPDPAAPKNYLMNVRGAAISQPGVSKFILRLQDLGLFDQVKLDRTGREALANSQSFSFEITCQISEEGRGKP